MDTLHGQTPPEEEKATHDFLAEFHARLSTFKEIPEEEQEDRADGLACMGIERLRQEIPAILFIMPEGEQMDIWMEDPSKIKNEEQPHDEIIQSFANFLGEEGMLISQQIQRHIIKATVLQDSEGNLYLVADEHWGREIQCACESVFAQYLYELFDKYKIKKVAMKLMQESTDTTVTEGIPTTSVIINQDIIGQRRIDRHLHEYAIKHGMTITQFIRFRLRAIGLETFKPPCDSEITGRDYNDIAQEILND